MKKLFAILVVALISMTVLFAAEDHLSVPIGSDAYRIIAIGEIRGIIPTQPAVKPYTLGKVRELLSLIQSSSFVSDSERATIDALLLELDRSYGGAPATSFGDVFQKGYVDVASNDVFSTYAGAKLSTSMTMSHDGAKDMRIKAVAYLRGDIADFASFNMDFGIIADKLNHNAFLSTDFTSECEGVYMDLLHGGGGVYDSPFDGFAEGYQMTPELGVTTLNGSLTARFGAIKRDWGVGLNNIALSGSARTFDGIEFTYAPSSWFSFSYLNGSLGKAWVGQTGETQPVGDREMHTNLYDNNFTLQRVELEPFKGFRASIYESVVWRKRAELAYWNPLGVYMFVQNYLGDFDNCLAGMDFSYTLPGIGKAYFGFALDEMNAINPTKIFTYARNIWALQGGLQVLVPGGDFSKLTLQATYIPPFFGSHYVYGADKNPWGDCDFGTAYVNKGQTLSYPLNPDSVELLMKYETTLPYGVSLEVIAKDQMRSAQYATSTTGTSIGDTLNYSYHEEYATKQFFQYLWNNELDVEVKAKKALSSFPMTLNFGLQAIVDSTRSYTVQCVDNASYPDLEPDHLIADYSNTKYNFGNGTTMGDEWKSSMRLIGSFGLSLYY